jgi:hypothetical protein
MRKRTARRLRRIADRLDPKPARWYASAWQQSANTGGYGRNLRVDLTTGIGDSNVLRAYRKRVLADYLTAPDFRKLRP